MGEDSGNLRQRQPYNEKSLKNRSMVDGGQDFVRKCLYFITQQFLRLCCDFRTMTAATYHQTLVCC